MAVPSMCVVEAPCEWVNMTFMVKCIVWSIRQEKWPVLLFNSRKLNRNHVTNDHTIIQPHLHLSEKIQTQVIWFLDTNIMVVLEMPGVCNNP